MKMDIQPLDEQEIKIIKEQGCCLGAYRALLGNAFYCYLEKEFHCSKQDKKFIEKLSSNMYVCETDNQRPCGECSIYRKYRV